LKRLNSWKITPPAHFLQFHSITTSNLIIVLEALVKTSYQIQVTELDDDICANPLAFGSGFIVTYKNEFYFITADHVLHIDDYTDEVNKRTWTDFRISVFNNINPKTDFISTTVTPLSGFYYLEKFDLKKTNYSMEPVDITVCKMSEVNREYPFLTDEVKFENEIINAGEQKFYLREESFALPCKEKEYFVYGKVKTDIEGIQLKSFGTLKSGLKYIDKAGDYFLLNTQTEISDRDDWEGLSGSPVLSETGECIGVLCSVNEGSKSIWIMPIHNVKILIEIAYNQELQLNNKQT